MTPVPEISLSSGNARKMPVLGMGTVSDPRADRATILEALLQAIKHGYRHIDTAAFYQTEPIVGEAVAEAINRGLIKSRAEVFISTKLWCQDAHVDRVLPAVEKSLRNLNMEYIDLYLIHWPVSIKPRAPLRYPIWKEDFEAMDFRAVWAAMEACQRAGLIKAIGVSNFSCKKLSELLAVAEIPPAVNQVEVNPCWQQKKLRDFCSERGVLVVAYAPLGAAGTRYGTNRVMELEMVREIAERKGKTVAQVCLRWAYEQGIGVVVKSFDGGRMKQNMEIFDWELTEEEAEKIAGITQIRACRGLDFTSVHGPFKTVEELWDGEI